MLCYDCCASESQTKKHHTHVGPISDFALYICNMYCFGKCMAVSSPMRPNGHGHSLFVSNSIEVSSLNVYHCLLISPLSKHDLKTTYLFMCCRVCSHSGSACFSYSHVCIRVDWLVLFESVSAAMSAMGRYLKNTGVHSRRRMQIIYIWT